MMGLLFPVLLAGLGFGFEISNWYLKTRAMQNAADAAVIAAASNGEDNYNLEAAAVAANYGFFDGTDNVSVTASNDATCPAGDGINPPCYSVTISSKVPLFYHNWSATPATSRSMGYQRSSSPAPPLPSKQRKNSPFAC
jgi:Flp pilus assembly protein TadG